MSPHPLEVGAGRLAHLDGAACSLDTQVVVPLKGVYPGDSEIGHCQVRRRPRRLELVSCRFEVPHREIRALKLPVAAAENDPKPRRLDGLPERFQHLDAVRQELRRRRRLTGEPGQAPGRADDAGSFQRVGDVRQRALEQRHGFIEGKRPLGFHRALKAHGHRLRETSSAEQVVGAVDAPRRRHRCERVRRPPVKLLTARRDHVTVDGLLCQRVAPSPGARRARLLLDELLAGGGLERSVDRLVARVRHGGESLVVEDPTEDGAGLENGHGLRVLALEAEKDRVAHGVRNVQLAQRLPLPAARGAEDVAPLDCLLEHLLEHEGVALAAIVHEVAKVVPNLRGVEDGADDLRDPGRRQRLEPDGLGDPRTPPRLHHRRQWMAPVQLVPAIRDDEERSHRSQSPGQMVEELTGRRVRPVNVVDDEQQRLSARDSREQGDHGLEEAQPRLGRILAWLGWCTVRELREELRELARGRAEASAERAYVLRGEVVPYGLDEGQVGQRELGFAASAPEDGRPELAGARRELHGEPRLADACVAGDGHEPAVATVRRKQRVLEDGKLLVAPDEDGANDAVDHPWILPAPRRHGPEARPCPVRMVTPWGCARVAKGSGL